MENKATDSQRHAFYELCGKLKVKVMQFKELCLYKVKVVLFYDLILTMPFPLPIMKERSSCPKFTKKQGHQVFKSNTE